MASQIDPELDTFLKRIRLDKYRESIFNLNVLTIEDLQDIAEEELKAMGMNPIETRRFTREVRKELKLVSNLILAQNYLDIFLIV